jgi:histidine triad (HIT) family protein
LVFFEHFDILAYTVQIMADCIFCKIIDRKIPAEIVYEDKNFMAILDVTPINPGHTLLVSKKPFVNIFDMPDKLLEKIGPLLKKLSQAVKKATKVEGLNIGMNNGEVSGQSVFHMHIHIMPRTKDDGYQLWHGKPYDKKGQAKKMAEKIRKLI